MAVPHPLSQAGLQALSPVPSPSNESSGITVLGANAAQSVIIVALPAAIIIAILLVTLILSYAKVTVRQVEGQLPREPAPAAHSEKAEVPEQPLYVEMPVIVVQPNQEVLIGRRESFQIECNEESGSKERGDASSLHPAPIPSQEIYVVVTQPW